MKYLILILPFLVACAGHDTKQLPTSVGGSMPQRPAGQCAEIKGCTNANVTGYDCRQTHYDLTSPNLATMAAKYPGEKCLVTWQDYQANPTCDPQNPSDTCHGWNGPYKCCKVIQGPGAPVVP